MIEKFVNPIIEFIDKNGKEKVKISKGHRISTFLNMMTSLLQKERGVDDSRNDIYELSTLTSFLHVYGLLAGNIHDEGRQQVNEFLMNHLSTILGSTPADASAFDMVVNNTSSSLVPWESIMPFFVYSTGLPLLILLSQLRILRSIHTC